MAHLNRRYVQSLEQARGGGIAPCPLKFATDDDHLVSGSRQTDSGHQLVGEWLPIGRR